MKYLTIGTDRKGTNISSCAILLLSVYFIQIMNFLIEFYMLLCSGISSEYFWLCIDLSANLNPILDFCYGFKLGLAIEFD